MAYTSIIPVRCLDRAVDYVRDKTKTTRGPKSLQDAVDYAINREKTELDCFETGLSCVCETAFEDMRDTVQRWQQTAGVQGYHLVQSFAEGEVTPGIGSPNRGRAGRATAARPFSNGGYHPPQTPNTITITLCGVRWLWIMAGNTTAMPSPTILKCGHVLMRYAENMDFPSLRPKKANSPPCRTTFGWTNRRIVQTGHLWCARTWMKRSHRL